MAETVVLAEQEFSGFADIGGIYGGGLPVFPITDGQAYRVCWDGTEYECAAATVLFNGADTTGLGNFALAGAGGDTGEPFLIGVMADGSGAAAYTTDTDSSHTIAVYLVEAGQPGIVIGDHTGERTEYKLPDNLQVDTADGGTTRYIHESLVAEQVEKTVALDFSGGDMVVEPEEGQAFSSVKIPAPENLIAENIAEGVNIAGIIGALAAGGGGEIKYKQSSFKPTSSTTGVRINADIGFVPDILIVFTYDAVYSNASGSYGFMYFGASSAMKNAGCNMSNMAFDLYSSGIGENSKTTAIDAPYNSSTGITGADETGFYLGGYKPYSGYTYYYHAIGGLT